MADSFSPQKPQGERTLIEGVIHYFTIVLRYKWLVAATSGIAAATAVTFSFLSLVLPPERSPLPNTYRAYAIILLQQEEAGGLESTLASLGLTPPEAVRGSGFDNASLAVKVLNSREFVDTLIEDFHVYDRYNIPSHQRSKARDQITYASTFDYDKTTRTLTLGYAHTDPVFAHQVVDRMVELLNEWFLTRGVTNKLRRKALLEEKLAEVSEDITVLEEQVKGFQETYGVLKVEDLATSQSRVLDNLRAQLQLKEIEIQNYTRFVKIEDPTLVVLRSERENLIEQIQIVERGFANPSGTLVPSRTELPELAQRFENLTSALRIQKNIFEAMAQQYELTKLSLESEPVFTVLDGSEVPDEKAGPSRGKLSAIVTFLGFAGSIALVFLLHSLNSLVQNAGRVRRLTGRINEA